MNLTPPRPSENCHVAFYAELLLLLLFFFDPGTQFPRKEKNYAMQYKKSTKIKLE